MDFENYTLLKMYDLTTWTGCTIATEHLNAYYPDTQMRCYRTGDNLYVTFTAEDRCQIFTYNASELLEYIITELGKRPKSTRSKIPRAEADLYQSNPKRLREILQSFVDAHLEEFIPF
jgi:hypothetical protein